MISSSSSLGGNFVVASSLMRKAINLSLLDESRLGITLRLLASMFRDMTTRPVHGTLIASTYFAWYSILGLATLFFMSSVALLWS